MRLHLDFFLVSMLFIFYVVLKFLVNGCYLSAMVICAENICLDSISPLF